MVSRLLDSWSNVFTPTTTPTTPTTPTPKPSTTENKLNVDEKGKAKAGVADTAKKAQSKAGVTDSAKKAEPKGSASTKQIKSGVGAAPSVSDQKKSETKVSFDDTKTEKKVKDVHAEEKPASREGNSATPTGYLSVESLRSAEALDRAIVHRLQSKGFPQDKETFELNETGFSNLDTFSFDNALSSLLQDESLFPDTHGVSRPTTARASASASSRSTKNLNKIHPTAETLYSSASSNQPSITNLLATTKSAEQSSIVYKNNKFNLENLSREALCSDSHKSLRDMDVLSGTSVSPAVFGSPSMYRQKTFGASSDSLDDEEVEHRDRGNKRHNRSRSRSPSHGPTVGFSTSFANNLGEHIFESTMNEIIENGGEEFKRKYASWVWEAFRSHLIKMKSVLLSEFTQKMQETLEEREQEVANLKKQYREKLSEFDSTTEGFQRMIENLYQENHKVLKAKDSLIEKLKKEFVEVKKHFEQDLVRQLQSYRKEAEVEKLELQKRNDELMMIMLTDGSSKTGLEDSFKREIESLHTMIKALTTQNEVLHQQLEEATTSTTVLDKKTMEALQFQLEQAKEQMQELRKRVHYTEREKEDMVVSHNEEIAKLNRKIQESNTRYDHQLRDAAEKIDVLRKKYIKDTKEFKQRMTTQEAQHNQTLTHIKSQYGGQVEELSMVVSQLQSELTKAPNTSNGNRKFSLAGRD